MGQRLRARLNEDTIERLRRFGERAGLAFQIVDDVLDMTEDSAQLGKTAGKDTASDKATWPAVFGIERSQAGRAAADRGCVCRAGAAGRGGGWAEGRGAVSGRTEELSLLFRSQFAAKDEGLYRALSTTRRTMLLSAASVEMRSLISYSIFPHGAYYTSSMGMVSEQDDRH